MKKIINTYSILKMVLHLGTKIKSNGCLDIGMDEVFILEQLLLGYKYKWKFLSHTYTSEEK